MLYSEPCLNTYEETWNSWAMEGGRARPAMTGNKGMKKEIELVLNSIFQSFWTRHVSGEFLNTISPTGHEVSRYGKPQDKCAPGYNGFNILIPSNIILGFKFRVRLLGSKLFMDKNKFPKWEFQKRMKASKAVHENASYSYTGIIYM